MLRKALVTGGASPIGEAICRRLAASGARVIVHGHANPGRAAAVAAAIGGETMICDITTSPPAWRPRRRADPGDKRVAGAGRRPRARGRRAGRRGTGVCAAVHPGRDRAADAAGRPIRLKRADKHTSTAAIYAHWTGVQMQLGDQPGFISVHLVGDGWFWMISLPGGVMSVGVVGDASAFKDRQGSTQAL